MRNRCMVVCAALSVALAVSAAVDAASTLRVGSQVLTAGDSEVRVTELLGKPSHKFSSHRSRRSGTSSRGHSRKVIVLNNDSRAEKWQFRRDDHVTTVTIVDGKVSDIDDHRI